MLAVRWTPHPVIVTIRDNIILGSSYIPIISLLQGGPPKLDGQPPGHSSMSHSRSRSKRLCG